MSTSSSEGEEKRRPSPASPSPSGAGSVRNWTQLWDVERRALRRAAEGKLDGLVESFEEYSASRPYAKPQSARAWWIVKEVIEAHAEAIDDLPRSGLKVLSVLARAAKELGRFEMAVRLMQTVRAAWRAGDFEVVQVPIEQRDERLYHDIVLEGAEALSAMGYLERARAVVSEEIVNLQDDGAELEALDLSDRAQRVLGSGKKRTTKSGWNDEIREFAELSGGVLEPNVTYLARRRRAGVREGGAVIIAAKGAPRIVARVPRRVFAVLAEFARYAAGESQVTITLVQLKRRVPGWTNKSADSAVVPKSLREARTALAKSGFEESCIEIKGGASQWTLGLGKRRLVLIS